MTFTGWKTRINPRDAQIQAIVDPDVDARLTCIAVIDEASWLDSTIDNDWAQFRGTWPERRFILLTPKPSFGTQGYGAQYISAPGGYEPGANIDVHVPIKFQQDPLTASYKVMRDGNVPYYASDWFEASGIWRPEVDIKVCLLFVDVSGSMGADTVAASTKLFVDKMVAANYRYKSVLNGEERWIPPFLATLNAFGTL